MTLAVDCIVPVFHFFSLYIRFDDDYTINHFINSKEDKLLINLHIASRKRTHKIHLVQNYFRYMQFPSSSRHDRNTYAHRVLKYKGACFEPMTASLGGSTTELVSTFSNVFSQFTDLVVSDLQVPLICLLLQQNPKHNS